MNDEDCIHLIFPASACTICNGKDAAEKEWTKAFSDPFQASYRSMCHETCRRYVEPGEMIVINRKTGKVCHEGCESE